MIVKFILFVFVSLALLAVLASWLGLAEPGLITTWFTLSFIGSVVAYGLYRDDKENTRWPKR